MRYSYKGALAELVSYASSLGYVVDTASDKGYSYIDWVRESLNEPKVISIQGNLSYEVRVYIMLHELGHHEIRKNWSKFGNLFPIMAHAEQRKHVSNTRKFMRRDSYIVSSLQEEFMAWDEGLKLGLKLGIHLNMSKWVSFKSKCLKSYIRYYAQLRK